MNSDNQGIVHGGVTTLNQLVNCFRTNNAPSPHLIIIEYFACCEKPSQQVDSQVHNLFCCCRVPLDLLGPPERVVETVLMVEMGTLVLLDSLVHLVPL